MVIDPWVISQRLLAGEAERESVLADLPGMLGIDVSRNDDIAAQQKRMDEMAAEVARKDAELREKQAAEAREAAERERRAREK